MEAITLLSLGFAVGDLFGMSGQVFVCVPHGL